MNRIVKTCIPVMLVLVMLSCNDLGTNDLGTNDNDWTTISDCIMSVAVDYQSCVIVRDPAAVEVAFNEYISFARKYNQDILGYGNNWRFDSTSKHGTYKRVKYWSVSASWFSEQDKQWHKINTFDVSEDGKVVRLLGCM